MREHVELDIIAVTADSPSRDLEDWLDVKAAAHAVDMAAYYPFWRESALGGLTVDFPVVRTDYRLVRQGGVPVAAFHVSHQLKSNAAVGPFELSVHPAHRRRGIGTALIDAIVAEHKATGKKSVLTYALRTVPGGPARDESGIAFAKALGFTSPGTEIRRRVDLGAVDHTEAHAKAKAAAGERYSVVRFMDPMPEEYLADLAFVKRRLSADLAVYRDDWEATPHDTASLRGSEAAAAARLWRRPNVAIRDEESGRLVAWSNLSLMDADGVHADQGITVVLPEHRGHRLGALAKLELHRYAHEIAPGMRFIDTWNDGENVHMIRINEELGFVAVEAGDDVMRDI
ncbi:hypothetical protein Afil01_18560 [Actinorhabdospora filicis]|uniref:N-acetyltransferase domain-containing protein n=1 Tax=Actinorhabdospora filicis TaxID=1785913 RepID=A0A9W6SK12_9ACTN|nr:GNAT family N-acetyltransferase [Actinorhabdospora filicis]GLZ77049.1 hypothetical protein Afil01_18560 [Actinorhabdospora filicis]